MSDQIEVRDNGIEVTAAPKTALVSLEFLVGVSPRGFRVHRDMLVIGTDQHMRRYVVTGWNAKAMALEVERLDP